jgi:hypothetical protein
MAFAVKVLLQDILDERIFYHGRDIPMHDE